MSMQNTATTNERTGVRSGFPYWAQHLLVFASFITI